MRDPFPPCSQCNAEPKVSFVGLTPQAFKFITTYLTHTFMARQDYGDRQ